MNSIILRKLGKVLLVEPNPMEAELLKRRMPEDQGNSVEVVEHTFAAFIRLNNPDHGYNIVFLGSRPDYPDVARRLIRKELDLFTE